MKIIIVDRLNVYQMDRTLWYTIDYDRLNSIMNVSNDSNTNSQNVPLDNTHNEPMEDVNLTPPIPENNNIEISKEIISPSINRDKAYSQEKTDGLTENPSDTKLDARKIVSNCDLENIPEAYRDAVFKAILLLVHDINNYENIKIGDIYVPKDIAKAEMEKLDYFAIEHVIEKFKEAATTTKIKNPICYLKTCIFNAISEINIDIDAEVRYDMERDLYNRI